MIDWYMVKDVIESRIVYKLGLAEGGEAKGYVRNNGKV